MKDRRSITVKLSGCKRKSLNIMKLKMEETQIDSETKETKTTKLVVFYWFTSVDKTTESNLRLLAYWAWDRLIMGKNYHWSYTLLTAYAVGNDPKEEERVTQNMYNFVQEFYPKVER
jgi:hypothetical protein